LASFFEDAKCFFADSEDLLPLFEKGSGVFGEDFFWFGELGQVDAGFAAI